MHTEPIADTTDKPAMNQRSTSTMSRCINSIEEIAIASILALMTLVTVANVIARYVFSSNILWALEVTVFLFAWLVLLGASYAVKKRLHLGIDTIINLLNNTTQKYCALLSVCACLAYGILLLIGSWDYWSGFVQEKAFLETEDIPMPDFLQFFSIWFNDGEAYEKLPRFIPYFALPFGLLLLVIRIVQVGIQVAQGKVSSIIVVH